MKRLLVLIVVLGTVTMVDARGPQVVGVAGPQAIYQADLVAMHGRLAAGSPAMVIADAQRLAAMYSALGPYAAGFTPADYVLNRRLAEESFLWLSHAHGRYLTDWTVAPYLMNAYASMGGFYHDYGRFYPAGAFLSYGGASRMARWLYLSGVNRSVVERDLERYALAYSAAACWDRACFDWWAPPSAPTAPVSIPVGQRLPAPEVLKLGPIDSKSLTPDQRVQWTDLQDRFRPVAARALEARIRMDDLAARLAQRGMTVNSAYAATASSMQGFLEDAIELAAAHEFRLASEAVTKAEATRLRLSYVIGQ